MNQKQVGIGILIIGIIFLVFVSMMKYQDDSRVDQFIEETGTCYLDDGTCLHEEQDNSLYIIGWILSGVLIVFGGYMGFIDRTHEKLILHQEKVSTALKEAKVAEKKKDEFQAFLSAFEEDEQKLLKAIHEQEGITQSTLRFRTSMPKANVSSILKKLEVKEIITRKPKGKTKQVFLVKKF